MNEARCAKIIEMLRTYPYHFLLLDEKLGYTDEEIRVANKTAELNGWTCRVLEGVISFKMDAKSYG